MSKAPSVCLALLSTEDERMICGCAYAALGLPLILMMRLSTNVDLSRNEHRGRYPIAELLGMHSENARSAESLLLRIRKAFAEFLPGPGGNHGAEGQRRLS
jgi:hypothetical protein